MNKVNMSNACNGAHIFRFLMAMSDVGIRLQELNVENKFYVDIMLCLFLHLNIVGWVIYAHTI